MAIIALSPTLCSAGDYFFGSDTTATTAVQISDSTYWADTITTPANSGNLDSAIGWFTWNVGGPDSAKFVIYNNDSTFLDSTAKFAVTDANRTRYAAPFIIGAAISASTKYFVTFHFSATGTGGTSQFYRTDVQVSTWYKTAGETPATITAPSKDAANEKKAIGVYYSDAAATTVKKPGNAHLGNVKL